jgi:hypothetical protein
MLAQITMLKTIHHGVEGQRAERRKTVRKHRIMR